MQTQPRLLIIEDNRRLTAALYETLRNEYELEAVHSGKAGLYRAELYDYDLIILDLQLPDMYGLDVCQQLRERGHMLPILTLSGDAKVLSKINLLDAGANDYLTKPFSLGELKARLRAVMRKAAHDLPPAGPDIIVYEELSLNHRTREVFRNGQAIVLRRKEFQLFEYLLVHANEVVSREHLARYAWHGDHRPWANTVDVHSSPSRGTVFTIKLKLPAVPPTLHPVAEAPVEAQPAKPELALTAN